jgi:hypothetical protein
MSVDTERRRAARVSCRIPVRLMRGGHVTHGVTEDLSRTGVRVRVPLEDLHLEPDADFAGVARRLDQRLGEACVGEFHWQVLGSLVRKVLRVVRVARVTDDPTLVDLGCELRVPLDVLESEALGVDLPPLTTGWPPNGSAGLPATEPATLAEVAAAEASAAAANRRRAVLMPARARGRAPLRGQAPEVTERGVVMALHESVRLALHVDRQDATALLLAFDERYGSEHEVLLLEGDEPIWSGSARVTGLEHQRASHRMVLTLSLTDPLRPEELTRLGVA